MGFRTAVRYANALAQKKNLDPWRFSRPACTLSPTLSRKLNGRGARHSHALNRARSWRFSTVSNNGEGNKRLSPTKVEGREIINPATAPAPRASRMKARQSPNPFVSELFEQSREFRRHLKRSGLLPADMGSLLRYRAAHEQNERHQQNPDCS